MELLVVIAIIGILASVVLASLNTARAKGADAAIKSSINNSRAQAELWYDSNTSSYLNLCTNPTIINIQNAVNNAGGAFTCNASTSAGYVMFSPLKTSATTYFCVDNTGKSTTTTIAPTFWCP